MQEIDLKKKFRVGICGHRDLKKSEIGYYKKQITTHLKHLIKEYSKQEIFLVSALAEGADRLPVECAMEPGLRYDK